MVCHDTIVGIGPIWYVFDVVIAHTYFRYGRQEFPKTVDMKWFLPWSIAAFVVGFVTIYFSALEFGPAWGARYTAFAQNLMMSILFIGTLVNQIAALYLPKEQDILAQLLQRLNEALYA